MSSTQPTQREAALVVANRNRDALATLRAEARKNPQLVIDALMDPPEYIDHLLVVEVVAMARRAGIHADAIRLLGIDAIEDKVNLLQPVGRASEATRYWACEHGFANIRNRPVGGLVLPEPPVMRIAPRALVAA